MPLFQLLRLRGGLVIWQKDFSDRSEAPVRFRPIVNVPAQKFVSTRDTHG